MNAQTLLVVIDPLTDDQMALSRAVAIALCTKSRIHLFCCTYLDEQELGKFSSRKDAKHTQLTETRTWLDELAAPLLAQDIPVSCEVVWNQKWEIMVAQAAGRIGAALIVKTSFKHSTLERAIKRTSDVYLMRTAPCPVMLVKSDEAWQNGIILAAVSLEENRPEHEQLNNVIFSQARKIAAATNSELHLVSALDSTPELIKLFQWTDESEQAPVELVAQRFGLPARQIHLIEGTAKDVLTDTVQALHADLIIMGTVARSGLVATVLGNTAEKVLDLLEVDLLTVSRS
ncbi:universal stress protein [Simiduia aestuariiviva]|uniref:Universal stress protein E n=1 Tax=Simiduia aestuariiviva TaxID=1510459 RepID=A0A839UV48_9GAMM|nr:universal stress protein [Simiduia aestuariiviva]MBB3169906.1 universal stress protein E [Simiduia aestuariiviva]